MKSLAIIAVGFALASAAHARSDTDYPHRDRGQVVTLDMSLIDATTCIARELNRTGDATVLPVEGGNDIDFAVRPMWGPKMEPWETYKVRAENGLTTLKVFYRHPIKQKAVSKDVARLQKHCLKVLKIAPS